MPFIMTSSSIEKNTYPKPGKIPVATAMAINNRMIIITTIVPRAMGINFSQNGG
jgi:hypothetical protein